MVGYGYRSKSALNQSRNQTEIHRYNDIDVKTSFDCLLATSKKRYGKVVGLRGKCPDVSD